MPGHETLNVEHSVKCVISTVCGIAHGIVCTNLGYVCIFYFGCWYSVYNYRIRVYFTLVVMIYSTVS